MNPDYKIYKMEAQQSLLKWNSRCHGKTIGAARRQAWQWGNSTQLSRRALLLFKLNLDETRVDISFTVVRNQGVSCHSQWARLWSIYPLTHWHFLSRDLGRPRSSSCGSGLWIWRSSSSLLGVLKPELKPSNLDDAPAFGEHELDKFLLSGLGNFPVSKNTPGIRVNDCRHQ